MHKLEAVPTDGNSPVAAAPTEDWRTALPEPVREWQEVGDAKTPEAFWEHMGNIRSHVGSSIRPPGPDASDEDRAAFNQKLVDMNLGLMPVPDPDNAEAMATVYQQMGRPQEVTGYEVPQIEGVEPDQDAMARFMGAAHKAGLSKAQFKALVEPLMTAGGQADADAKLAREEGMQALRGEWGLAYDQNMTQIENLFTSFKAPEGTMTAIREKMSPDELRLFSAMAKAFGSEDKQISTQQAGGEAIMSPTEAGERISEIMNNKQHPYWNPADPGHKAARAKMRQLHEWKEGANNVVVAKLGAG